MSIQKDVIIYKDDVFEYQITKDYDYSYSKSLSGTGFLALETNISDVSGYFWIRNTPALYLSPAYVAGTTYATDDRVQYDEEAYYSIQDANTGNQPDISPLWWRLVEDANLITTFKNFYAYLNIGVYSGPDNVHIWLWKVTWDENQDEVLELKHEYELNSPTSVTYTTTEDPGYYKWRVYVAAIGARKSNTGRIKVKRGANDVDIGDRLRVFDADFKELLPEGGTNVTVAIAKAGRLSTDDFYGGEEFAT